MTHTFPVLDYANAAFEPLEVNEKTTEDPFFCESAVHDANSVQNEQGW